MLKNAGKQTGYIQHQHAAEMHRTKTLRVVPALVAIVALGFWQYADTRGPIAVSSYTLPACPAFDEAAFGVLARVLADSAYVSERLEIEIGAITVDDVRALTDSTDSTQCDYINHNVLTDYDSTLYTRHYFTGGDYYFVVYKGIAEDPATGRFNLVPDATVVLDSTFAMKGLL